MCKNRMPRNYKEFSRSREIRFRGIPKAEPEGDGLGSGGHRSRAVRLTRSLDLTLGKRSQLRSGTERGVQIQISTSTSRG